MAKKKTNYNTIVDILSVSKVLKNGKNMFFIEDIEGKRYTYFENTEKDGSWSRHLRSGVRISLYIRTNEFNGTTYLNAYPDRMSPNPMARDEDIATVIEETDVEDLF